MILDVLSAAADVEAQLIAQAELIDSIRLLVLSSLVPLAVVAITVLTNSYLARDARRSEWNIQAVRDARTFNTEALQSATDLWLSLAHLSRARDKFVEEVEAAISQQNAGSPSDTKGMNPTEINVLANFSYPADQVERNALATEAFRASLNKARVVGDPPIYEALKGIDLDRSEVVFQLENGNPKSPISELDYMLEPLYLAAFEASYRHNQVLAHSVFGIFGRRQHLKSAYKEYVHSREGMIDQMTSPRIPEAQKTYDKNRAENAGESKAAES